MNNLLQQDYLLKELVEKHGPRWGDIARAIGSTTGKQCRERLDFNETSLAGFLLSRHVS